MGSTHWKGFNSRKTIIFHAELSPCFGMSFLEDLSIRILSSASLCLGCSSRREGCSPESVSSPSCRPCRSRFARPTGFFFPSAFRFPARRSSYCCGEWTWSFLRELCPCSSPSFRGRASPEDPYSSATYFRWFFLPPRRDRSSCFWQ